jgi:hypothetical protein
VGRSQQEKKSLLKTRCPSDDDALVEKIEAVVPHVIKGVPREKAAGGSGHEFVESCGRCVMIADATKDTKVRITRGCRDVDGDAGGQYDSIEGWCNTDCDAWEGVALSVGAELTAS